MTVISFINLQDWHAAAMSVFKIKLHSFSTSHEARRSLTEHEARSMFMLHEAQRASLAGKSDSELLLSSPTPSSQAFTVSSPPWGHPPMQTLCGSFGRSKATPQPHIRRWAPRLGCMAEDVGSVASILGTSLQHMPSLLEYVTTSWVLRHDIVTSQAGA